MTETSFTDELSCKKPVLKKPSCTYIILLFILACIGVGLGLWQWHRAIEKEKQLLDYQKKQDSPMVPFHSIQNFQEYYGRQVQVQGHYLYQKQYLIDNQVIHKQVGYWLMTPFEVSGEKKLLLVNRGFISKQEAKKNLSLIERVTDRSEQMIQGELSPVRKPLYFLGKGFQEPFSKNTTIIQGLWLESLEKISAAKFYPIVLLLKEDKREGGLLRAWAQIQNKTYLTPSQHYAYAGQWFFLASLFLLWGIYKIVVYLQTRRKTHVSAK